jgi:hypothetical protein
VSRAARVRLTATLVLSLLLVGPVAQTTIGSDAQAKAWAYVQQAVGQTQDEGIRLPTTDAHHGPVKDYVEAVPQADYKHAPPAAVEAFKDIKYGVRIQDPQAMPAPESRVRFRPASILATQAGRAD